MISSKRRQEKVVTNVCVAIVIRMPGMRDDWTSVFARGNGKKRRRNR